MAIFGACASNEDNNKDWKFFIRYRGFIHAKNKALFWIICFIFVIATIFLFEQTVFAKRGLWITYSSNDQIQPIRYWTLYY
ncbi:hypothetical protein BGI33_05725 [Snodgrassella alvi]|uniref:Uncharacterized protein n=1 Tax=Snodgrassella alvi TaxID=1196083 RepID=A0A2N9WRJ1_9NEIS|nr:hypothetical protein BGI32_11190 [Snodgrassella alvi]PIT15647.1 hypothetical protein BGI33_05725 [Snodgrassella alvi]